MRFPYSYMYAHTHFYSSCFALFFGACDDVQPFGVGYVLLFFHNAQSVWDVIVHTVCFELSAKAAVRFSVLRVIAQHSLASMKDMRKLWAKAVPCILMVHTPHFTSLNEWRGRPPQLVHPMPQACLLATRAARTSVLKHRMIEQGAVKEAGNRKLKLVNMTY